jgi:hypothetical protein
MIEKIEITLPIPPHPSATSTFSQNIKGRSFKLAAAFIIASDAGGAVPKVMELVVQNAAGIAYLASGTPQIGAAQTSFVQFGIGMSSAIGVAPIAARTHVQASLPDIWNDEDSTVTVTVLDAEANTFITRAVLFLETKGP